MKFLIIGDFHYKKNMYASTVAHLNNILHHAHEEKVDFVIHTGDFSNDYIGSPEILDTYLHNKYALPVFGIYGNHELESRNNTMHYVTPRLCNQPVMFDGEEGYWHYDIGDFRLIGLDTNYSFHEASGQWQHNLPASWGAPDENKFHHSLGPVQMQWLEHTIQEASRNGKKAIVFSHAALSGEWASSPDADAVRDIFARYPGTVLLNVNGHLHTDHFCIKDSVAYFDVNAAINGFWAIQNDHHYTDAHTFVRERVDAQGNVIGREEARLNSLSQGKNTWFFEKPLFTIVEITEDGNLKITGSEASWMYGIEPPDDFIAQNPEISARTAKIL